MHQSAVSLVEQATNEAPGRPPLNGKHPAAIELGRLGGLKGGRARAGKLSPKAATDIAKKAAETRWAKRRTPG